MSSGTGKWTPEQRGRALRAFLVSDDGKRFFEIFSRECAAEDLPLFRKDAEGRRQADSEEAENWWSSLAEMLESDSAEYLAFFEPLAQSGIAIDDIYESLPDAIDPAALIRAFRAARDFRRGAVGLSTEITDTTGWSEDRIFTKYSEVKSRLGLESAPQAAHRWWEDFEIQGRRSPSYLLRLAAELATRNATVSEFFDAFTQANTESIQATLHYLDYTRLKKKEDSQLAATGGIDDLRLTAADTGSWSKPKPGLTWVKGWTEEQILSRLEEVKIGLALDVASEPARRLWDQFEIENQHRPAPALRLAEELANRKASINEFYHTVRLSGSSDIQANLHYLDYTRLNKNAFEYETLVLDETGKIEERRRGKARQILEELAPGISIEMIEIRGGTFLMGSPKDEVERRNDEGPQHEVEISPFHIGKYAITQEQWNVVARWPKVERELNQDPSQFKGNDRPVEKVSWFDAVEFCARLSRKSGRQYRLPTEAEWEYACRAGTTSPFTFGETITSNIVNYNGEYPYAEAQKGEYRSETIPVGSLGVANAFGLYDMHGNVWEWCQDWYAEDYYKECLEQGVAKDPAGPARGSSRVLRGGSYYNNGYYCRSAYRYFDRPDDRNSDIGFRVVVPAGTS